MRRTPLDAIDGWDAYNVTEDADLSFRLAANGHKIGFIHPPTQEEAVSNLRSWHFQRARWIKGYIQTWDVHMAAPFAPGGLIGGLRFFTLQLTLGFTLLAALFYAPVLIGLHKAELIPHTLTMPLYWLLLFSPALRAFSELKSNRFHWHKTQHGVSRPTINKPIAVPELSYVPFRRFAD